MLLSDLTLPMPYAECRDLAIVYPYEVAVALYEIQQEHGDPRHICYGRHLTDGRWIIDGEVLSAVGEGDIFGWIATHITPEMMSQVEVVPLGEVAGLLQDTDTPDVH